MKKLIIDLDNTITIHDDSPYENKPVNISIVEKMKEYKNKGYTIVIFTARNMKTFDGNIGKINIHTLPKIIDWLKRNDIPFDEIIVGKPWCGHDGFYIDDRAIRPSEFAKLTPPEIENLLALEIMK